MYKLEFVAHVQLPRIMPEVYSFDDNRLDFPGLHLQLVGTVDLRNSGGQSILPPLRRAGAVMVILALSENMSASRRQIAKLLWSRSPPQQAMARLRDTLHEIKKSLNTALPGTQLLRVLSDRLILQIDPGQVDALQPNRSLSPMPLNPLDIAADLDGIDPAFDQWLSARRRTMDEDLGRARAVSEAGARQRQGKMWPHRKGAVLGICPLRATGISDKNYLSFSIVEEIGTALARLGSVVLISSSSVAAALAAGQDLVDELGLDFFLEGTLQQTDARLKISVKLVEAKTRIVAWSAQFEHWNDDLIALEEEVASRVAASIEPQIPLLEASRLQRAGTRNRGAYDLVLQAICSVHLLNRQSFMLAGSLLGEAIQIDPLYASAYAWLALWNIFLVGQGWASNPQQSIRDAGDAAQHAIELDPNDSRGLTVAGHVRAFLDRNLTDAMLLHERALVANPSLPIAWHFSAVAQAYAGKLPDARRRLERCHQLAPLDPHRYFSDGALIIVELLSGNIVEAVEIGRRVTRLHPRFSAAYKPYLAALGHAGRLEEAAETRRCLLQLEPDFTIRRFFTSAPFVVSEQLAYYVAGLRLAGLVEC